MAHFLLTPVGSSGDVHPFVGIGRTLRGRGHDVTLLTSEPFRRTSERAGLRFVGTRSEEDYDRLTKGPDLWHSRRGMTVVLRALMSGLSADYAHVAAAFEPGRTVLVSHALGLATRVFEKVPARRLRPSTWRRRSSDPTINSPSTFPGLTRPACPRG